VVPSNFAAFILRDPTPMSMFGVSAAKGDEVLHGACNDVRRW
jgi:hypothetical protein